VLVLVILPPIVLVLVLDPFARLQNRTTTTTRTIKNSLLPQSF
jgi:hypothetical protein